MSRFKRASEVSGVSHIIIMTRSGALGLLPHRLDCTAAIAPGIMAYRTGEREEIYLAVDEGVLVKTGLQVVISVRNAIGGQDLGKLRAAVEHEFLNLVDANAPADRGDRRVSQRLALGCRRREGNPEREGEP
jgi:F-type H+-transporting ATPase subunit epsilon